LANVESTNELGAHAIVYRRVSSEEQADSRLGLEAQLADCQACAARLGLPIGEYFADEGLSAGLPIEKRPGLIDALAHLRPGDTLLVQKRDRLVRDVFIAIMIERQVAQVGARLVSAAGEGTADDEPSSVLLRRVLDSFNEYERAMIRVRTVAAMLALKRRGMRRGNVPYGFTLDADRKRLHVAPAELAIIDEITARVQAGEPLRAVAADLTRRGVPTKRGRPWSFQSVAALVGKDRRPAEGIP